MARTTSYRREFAEQAKKLCELGATDREVAEFLGRSERTIRTWKAEHPEFGEAMRVGKEAADARVEQSLYRRATGYSFDALKIDTYQGRVIKTRYVEHIPPDVTACIFWLKNRKPDEWRDVKAVEHDVGKRLARLADDELESRIAQLLRKAGAAAAPEREGPTH